MRNHLQLLTAVPLLIWLAGCGGGGSSTSSPPPQNVTVSVSTTATSVAVGGNLFFTATVTGTTNHAVTWEVNGMPGGDTAVGVISASGVYGAPAAAPSPATVTVTAVSQADPAKSASRVITVALAISPSSATLNISDPACNSVLGFGEQGASAVTWAVTLNGAPAPASFGTFLGAQYDAPDAIPDPLTFNVTATSLADATQTGSASVTLQAGSPTLNQGPQTAPIKLGTSGGNVKDTSANFCCSGTLGALVVRNGTNFILSNNHVLARSGKAAVGEAIGQPGLVDTFQCSAGVTVANFTQAVKLNPGGTSLADAAIAQVAGGLIDPTGAILGLGPTTCGVAGAAPPASTIATPTIGMAVAKSGRTTGLTCSTISAVNLQVQVQYENTCGSQSTFVVTYNNQIDIVSPTFSAAGDSGSLIVDAQTAEPVGLLYAGSDTDTVANPIQTVLTNLADTQGHQPAFVGGATHTVPACTGTNGPFGASAQGAANARLQGPSDQEVIRITGIKEAHTSALMSDPAVLGVGVGVGRAPGEGAIVILIDKDRPHRPIPAQLDGVKTKVRLVKRFRARGAACPASSSEQVQVGLR